MRKFSIICLLLVCFLLVGCGVKKTNTETNTNTNTNTQTEVKKQILICSLLTKQDTVNFTTEMAYYFENDKAVKLGVKYTYDLSKYTQTQRDAWATVKMCELDTITDDLGMTECQEALVGTDYLVKGYSAKLLAQSSGATLSQGKKQLEDAGWTCIVQ